MKLDPVFTVKNNRLYKIADDSQVEVSSLKRVDIPWSTIELSPESYNEEYLANLREELKPLDETGSFVYLAPKVDKALNTPEDIELYINAFNHCARRIKDCQCVAGIELPAEVLSKGTTEDSAMIWFMETLAKKHGQYVYFAAEETVKNLNLADKLQNLAIVIY